MQRFVSTTGATVSYEMYGRGPAMVLVHGSFSDHDTNWEFVKPILENQFTIHAIARRGRGETDRTEGHTLEEEGQDVAALIRIIGEPVFLLGHSYGAQAALAAAAAIPDRVRRLVLYEAPWPGLIGERNLARLEELADDANWDGFAETFFRDALSVPVEELREVKASDLWAPIVADAQASLHDLRALGRYDFKPDRFGELRMPVMLQVGSESPRGLFVTDALADALPHAHVHEFAGQAHEGMTTAPGMYAEAVTRFLLG
jgi:pimeloyl-ACP methyl ester carboxylesterase